MGYRVGFQCFDTVEAATDYQMSQVLPQIVSDGTLHYPIKKGDTWSYAGQPVNLSFGFCDPMQDFKDGLELAGAYVSLFALVFMFKFLTKFLWSMFVEPEPIERD